MDHKVSKDMISSGMIPSGEKTQADLGRTQYGSTPSPSKLMDAYKSMYDKKEEVINEMSGKGMGMTPAPKPQGITPASKPGGIAKPKPPLPTPVEKGSSSPAPKTDSRMDQVKKQGFAKSYRKIGPKSETEDMLDKVKDRQVEKAVNRDKDVRRARASYIMTKYGESVDLLAAYRSVYEHHKKDADGNTIPHEHEEELNEGKLPAGLQAYLDKKKGKKEDKKDMKEKYDLVYEHFIGEGFSEEETYERMSNLTEEQLDEFITALSKNLATRAAQYGANLGKPASQKINVVNPPRKPFDAKRKPFDAKKPEPKLGDSGFKAKSASDVVNAAALIRKNRMRKELEPKKGEVMQDEYQHQIDEAPLLTTAFNAVKNIITKKGVKDFAKDAARGATMQMGGQVVSRVFGGGGGGQPKQKSGQRQAAGYTQYNSADLFDIVKGQLLDEGLSEEEIKDIMLTLTPDEIMKEMNQ